jgi:hypothetical protein
VAEVIFTFLFRRNTESIQPVEIAKEILRAMQRNKQISITNVYVPNVYKVTLNPEDYKTITNFGKVFLSELSRHIYEEGTKQGYTFLTVPSIELIADNSLIISKMKLDVGFDDNAVANWFPDETEACYTDLSVEHTSVLSRERSVMSREREERAGEASVEGRKLRGDHEIDPYLEFVEGFHIGKVYHLDLSQIVIGRQKTCDLAELCREKMGIEAAPDFQGLIGFIDRIYPRHLSAQAEKPADSASDPTLFAPESAEDAMASRTNGGKPLTRRDVITMLDTVCRFLEETEPANPAPLLIRRARDLIGKDFLAILQTLAPDGLAQVKNVAGITS